MITGIGGLGRETTLEPAARKSSANDVSPLRWWRAPCTVRNEVPDDRGRLIDAERTPARVSAFSGDDTFLRLPRRKLGASRDEARIESAQRVGGRMTLRRSFAEECQCHALCAAQGVLRPARRDNGARSGRWSRCRRCRWSSGRGCWPEEGAAVPEILLSGPRGDRGGPSRPAGVDREERLRPRSRAGDKCRKTRGPLLGDMAAGLPGVPRGRGPERLAPAEMMPAVDRNTKVIIPGGYDVSARHWSRPSATSVGRPSRHCRFMTMASDSTRVPGWTPLRPRNSTERRHRPWRPSRTFASRPRRSVERGHGLLW
ncbi:hypothetical protein SCANM124S_01077 [Streptomyces canus]